MTLTARLEGGEEEGRRGNGGGGRGEGVGRERMEGHKHSLSSKPSPYNACFNCARR